jgi:hypothetical protein
MSGIEIAGLVLAVVPLFISALEHYEDGLRPVRVLKLVVYRQELARYRTKLTVEYGLYNSALEELLVDVVPQHELRDMIAQGYGPHWKSAALEDKLRKRLGSVYDTYFLVMKQMQDVMAKIASLLDIQRQGNVSQLSRFLPTRLILPIDHWSSARRLAACASTKTQSDPRGITFHHIRV